MADKQLRGVAALQDPAVNKSTAFSPAEREAMGLRGLLPAAVSTQDLQVQRALENLRRKDTDIGRYVFLSSLSGRNERLFYRLVMDHLEEILPLIYTPTVGQACKEFAHIYRGARGFYVTPQDRGEMRHILDNWPHQDIRVVVVTDGERILGLGDLGANGMGIPVGKAALYTACGGIDPRHCLPVMFDTGTNNAELLDDPLYLGARHPRIRGDDYLALMDEFVDAVRDAWPAAIIQFEDFVTPNAYALLHRYQERVTCFNDDIQGTAATALAGILAASRIAELDLRELRVMFLGAGAAATGIADLMVNALVAAGVDSGTAHSHVWLVDRKGLVTANSPELAEYKKPFAHDHPPLDFLGAIREIRPNVLIGATGQPGTFNEEAVRLMASVNDRPIIFALSNPTSRSECTAEQAYQWTGGRAVFASGSPFAPVDYQGRILHPGQGNNAYVFPGIGLGALVSAASAIDQNMFLIAAQTLASQVSEAELEDGSAYPRIVRIRDVSAAIATRVAEYAYESGLAGNERPDDIEHAVRSSMYDPHY
ncbi:MAG: NAD-dependent malic enzyme [Gammaproteobacteria bacterium]|jgi:malate dehydrogenase (oxaloacetate-decarboxylating)(NADP+)|nr:NAD-dependent malic enzyme [Gammaproteobacteria bacterium]